MTISSAMSSLLARTPTSAGFDRFMSALGNPSPDNIMPVLAPEMMNIPGKCAFAAKRTGFLEFQERLFEEVTTGVMWLFGVKTLGKVFDWGWKRLAPGPSRHLDMEIDWGRYNKPFMALTPGERYAFNHQEWQRILVGRGTRLAVSIAATLGVISILLPWLNLKKTEWLLKRFYRPESPRQTPATQAMPPMPQAAVAAPQAAIRPAMRGSAIGKPVAHPTATGLPPRQNPAWSSPAAGSLAGMPWAPSSGFNALPPAQNTAWISSATGTLSGMPWAPSSGLNALPPAQNTAWISPTPGVSSYTRPSSVQPSIQFGFSGGSSLRGIANAIENTDSGHILVIDGGIVAGRSGQDYQRSPFAGLEVAYREGASLYFYILAMPHVAAALNKLMKPALATTTLLDPAVAERITRQILNDPTLQRELAEGKPSTQRLNQLLTRLFDGDTGPLASQLEHATEPGLSQSLRTATLKGETGFLKALHLELGALLEPEQAQRLHGAIQAEMAALSATPPAVTADGLHANQAYRLVQRLEKREGAFASLSRATAEDAALAVKQAFGATAGMAQGTLQQGIAQLAERLGQDAAPVLQRLERMADHDVRARAAQILTRSVNAFRATHGPEHPTLAHAKPVLRLLEASWLFHDTPTRVLARQAEQAMSMLSQPKVTRVLTLSPQAHEALRAVAQRLPVSAGPLAALRQAAGQAAATRLPETLKTALGDMAALLSPDAAMDDRQLAGCVDRLAAQLEAGLKAPEGASNGRHALVAHYRQQLARMFDGTDRRVFSLVVDDPARPAQAQAGFRKLSELAHGGLKRNKSLLRNGMRLVHWLSEPGDRRAFRNITKSNAMRRGIREYADQLRTHLLTRHGANQAWDRPAFEAFLNTFQRLSKNSRYVSQLTGLAVAGVGLGILVPKTQYALTRLFTGKNEHPGIASVAHQNGVNQLVDADTHFGSAVQPPPAFQHFS